MAAGKGVYMAMYIIGVQNSNVFSGMNLSKILKIALLSQ